jgi:hypothetical protein
VSVIDPTSADQRTFHDYGPMPDRATTEAHGLDTPLDQGPSSSSSSPPATSPTSRT